MALFEKIEQTILSLDSTSISQERKESLSRIASFIQDKMASNDCLRLNFICTHNSRRSHLAQVWAQTLSSYFALPKVFCYSAGTEATALFPMVLKTLESTGFEITVLAKTANPIYGIKHDRNEAPILGFSKTLDSTFNPKSEFVAIMTCSQADADCPNIQGAEKRFALSYDDPKIYDHSELQNEKYRERSLQIASEMKYLFSKIKK